MSGLFAAAVLALAGWVVAPAATGAKDDLAADPSADIANMRRLRHVDRGGVLRSLEELQAAVASGGKR